MQEDFEDYRNDAITSNEENAIKLYAYPNPVIEGLNIEFDNENISKDCKVSIINSLGILIKKFNESEMSISSNKIYVLLDDLSSGSYILQVENHGVKYYVRFIRK